MIVTIGNITIEGSQPEAELVTQVAMAYLQQMDETTPTQTQIDEVTAAYYVTHNAATFSDLPEWATYTADEAVAAVHNAIAGGNTLAVMKSQIDGLPNSFAGMKTGLKAVADDIAAIRGILEKMAKVQIYLRDRTT